MQRKFRTVSPLTTINTLAVSCVPVIIWLGRVIGAYLTGAELDA